MKKLATLAILTLINVTATAAAIEAPQPSATANNGGYLITLQLPDWYQQYNGALESSLQSAPGWKLALAAIADIEPSGARYTTTANGITNTAGETVQLTPAQQKQLPAIVGAIQKFNAINNSDPCALYGCAEKVNYYHVQNLDSNPTQNNVATAQNTNATVTPPPQTRAAMPTTNATDAENQWN